MKKFLAGLMVLSALSGCATLFYENKHPTFNEAPVACTFDVIGGVLFLGIPAIINMVNGNCKS